MGATNPKLVAIAGPTAAGKSALALALAAEFDGVIINADSQQRWADLRILTARPSAADEARAPHKLFGDLAADQTGSAAEWALKAAVEIKAATAENKLPILVGGTGLYFRALLEGLSDMPSVPAEVRAAAKALRDVIGPAAFHARLATRDPEIAARLAPGDTQRTLRAWEVVEGSGTPLSIWQKTPGTLLLAARALNIVVLPPRDDLYAACDARFIAMLETGAIAEVQALLTRGADLTKGLGKALGVPQIATALAGDLSLREATTLAQTATRQYAKRQMTWFRNQFRAELTISKKFSESLLSEIFIKVREFS